MQRHKETEAQRVYDKAHYVDSHPFCHFGHIGVCVVYRWQPFILCVCALHSICVLFAFHLSFSVNHFPPIVAPEIRHGLWYFSSAFSFNFNLLLLLLLLFQYVEISQHPYCDSEYSNVNAIAMLMPICTSSTF